MSNARQPSDLKRIAGAFGLLGSFESGAPYGSGHINDTFALVYDQGGRPIRYILQRVNENVFKNGEALMENIRRVTAHQHAKLAASGASEASRRALSLVPAADGCCFHRDPEGGLWRVYIFVERATGHDRIETTAQAEAAAKAFGEFQKLLVDLPGGPLHETIPQFHDTASRFRALLKAVEADVCNRAAGVNMLDVPYKGFSSRAPPVSA